MSRMATSLLATSFLSSSSSLAAAAATPKEAATTWTLFPRRRLPAFSPRMGRVTKQLSQPISASASAHYFQEEPTVVISPPSAQTTTTFDFKLYVAEKVTAVNAALDLAVPFAPPARINEAMRYTLLAGGKRMKPLLCIAACSLVGGNDAIAMPSACALEMIHTTAIIQDDLPCLDNGDLRRGVPTNHRVFGEAHAVLGGAALVTLAFQYAAATPSPDPVSPDRVLRAITELARGSGSGFAGQAMDMELTGSTEKVELEQLVNMSQLKSGALLEAAVVMGATVGGGNDVQVQRLRKYARCIGILFQVVDDILDVTMSSEELGKTAGRDVIMDKQTYIKLLGLDKSREYAAQLNKEAKDQLADFDQVKALPLYYLADYIAHRHN